MEQIVNYLTYYQEKTRFPDRTARLVRDHPFMTQLDFFDMQEAQQLQWREQAQRQAAIEAAAQMGQGVAEAEAVQHHAFQALPWHGDCSMAIWEVVAKTRR